MSGRGRASVLFVIMGIALGFMGLLACLAAVSLFGAWKGGAEGWWLMAWIPLIGLCAYALRCCRDHRAYLLHFSDWKDMRVSDKPGTHLAAIESGAKRAFLLAEYPQAALLLGKAMALEPGNPELIRNLASTQAMSSDHEALGNHLAIHEMDSPRWKFMVQLRHKGRLARSSRLLPSLAPMGLFFLLAALPVGQVVVEGWSYVLRLSRGFSSENFEVAETAHFEIYYHDEKFLGRTMPIAEEALAYDLKSYGLPEGPFSSQKIKLYLCDSQKEYLARSPRPRSWEQACAMPSIRSIYLWNPPDPYGIHLKTTLAHEVSHLCFHQVWYDEDDDWLNEGLACYLGFRYALQDTDVTFKPWMLEHVFKGLKKKRLPFHHFLEATPSSFRDDTAGIELFYNQGFSVVFMLIEYFGEENFFRFLKAYSANKSIERALETSFPKISNIQDLQGMWLLFMAT